MSEKLVLKLRNIGMMNKKYSTITELTMSQVALKRLEGYTTGRARKNLTRFLTFWL